MKKHERLRSILRYFSPFEWSLLGGSITVILTVSALSRATSPLSLVASLIGATALVFLAKGNVTGQILTVVFSILYGIISYGQAYYGEMITYLGMTMPIALWSVIVWLRHPFAGRRAEVEICRLKPRQYLVAVLLGVTVTVPFYFLLRALGTARLLLSTVSVFTSLEAVWLSLKRSPAYALGYAANDVVLILLWLLAARESPEALGMVVCFLAFLVSDLYGFFNWQRMERAQKKRTPTVSQAEPLPREDAKSR